MYQAQFKIEGLQEGGGNNTEANDFKSKCWSSTSQIALTRDLQANNRGECSI